MPLMEMSHWLWTWGVWGKAKCGLMDRVLEDIGLHMPMVIVTVAVIRGRFGLQNVSLAVVSQRNDGKPS